MLGDDGKGRFVGASLKIQQFSQSEMLDEVEVAHAQLSEDIQVGVEADGNLIEGQGESALPGG